MIVETDELVEKVARAAFESHGPGFVWKSAELDTRVEYRKEARAAIRALSASALAPVDRTKALRLVARELCDQPEICEDCLAKADMLITTYETGLKMAAERPV